MVLKLLIAACLVTHGLGRPDVSHILKRENQSEPKEKAFHPFDYLSRQLGNVREFEARAASESEYNVFDYLTAINGTEINALESKSAPPAVGRRNGSRSFRNIVKPSPFKKNTAEYGYTYEKPADPFDFPINPDANLIKPVSTQAPEYLPPVEQGPTADVDNQPVVPDQRPTERTTLSSVSPLYPELPTKDVSAPSELPENQNQNGYSPTDYETGTSPSPTEASNQPDTASISPTQESTPNSVDQTTATTDEASVGSSTTQTPSVDGFTGYPQGPSSSQVPNQETSTTGYPQSSVPTTTEKDFTGYPLGSTSSTDQGSSPEYPSFVTSPQSTTDSQFTGYPQGPSTATISDREYASESTMASSDSPQDYSSISSSTPNASTQTPTSISLEYVTDSPSEPSQNPNVQSSTIESKFIGYPQQSSSTPSADQGSQTVVPNVSLMPFNGYPSSDPNVNKSITTLQPTLATDSVVSTTQLTTGDHLTTEQNFNEQHGYNYDKPILPPNLTEVIGEPIDINDLATTTLPSTTSRKPSDGLIIPPKPRPELVVPVKPSSQSPSETVASTTEATAKPSTSILVSSSTSAPEYLPPEGTNLPQNAYDTTPKTPTDAPLTEKNDSTTSAEVSSNDQEKTTFSGYPTYERESTTLSSTFEPSIVDSTTPGLAEQGQESSTYAGYPSVSQTTVSASISTKPSQETTTALNYPNTVEQEMTTFGGYMSGNASEFDNPTSGTDYQTTTGASFSTFEPFDNASAVGQPFPTTSSTTDQPSSELSSTAALEYLPPDTNDTSNQYYPSPNKVTTVLPEDYSEQPAHPDIPSYNLVNQTDPSKPNETDTNQVSEPIAPQTTMENMDMISEINGLIPDNQPNNGYLPPSSENGTGLHIIVDDTSFALPPQRPVSESDAEGSELNLQLAVVPSTSEGYSYQAPDERLPVPVIPSHTLEDDGYHYKIPSVPFP